MAAFIGALSGLLIGPTTTVFYDSGFLIGLKGFVAAVFGGLASYPLAAGRRAVRGPDRELRLLLGQRLQGSDRVHARSCRCCCGARCAAGHSEEDH